VARAHFRDRANAADRGRSVTLRAAESVEGGAEAFAGVLNLDEVVKTNTEEFKLLDGDTH
jgi:hypothetical protein